jgi:hypothetical protein
MANIDSFDVPRPSAGEHTYFQNLACYILIYAPATVHETAPETRASVGSSRESEAT